jgi:hypothetical protein
MPWSDMFPHCTVLYHGGIVKQASKKKREIWGFDGDEDTGHVAVGCDAV